MARVIKSLGVKLHPAAGCEDCNWQCGSSPVTRVQAKFHAQQSGHTVVVETVTRDVYRQERS